MTCFNSSDAVDLCLTILYVNPSDSFSFWLTNSSSEYLQVVVQQVLERLEDVNSMCNKRRDSLRRLVSKPPRPVQAVLPKPINQPVVQTTPNKAFLNVNAENEEEPKRKLRPSIKIRVMHWSIMRLIIFICLIKNKIIFLNAFYSWMSNCFV